MNPEYILILSHTELCLRLINIVLHGTGMSLFLSIPKRNRTPQKIFLMNICCTEMLNSLLLIVVTGGDALGIWPPPFSRDPTPLYIVNICHTGIQLMYFLAIGFLTCDRLLCVMLTLRYPTHCTRGRAMIAVKCCWIAGAVVSLGVYLHNHFLVKGGYDAMFDLHFVLSDYPPLILSVTFLIFALFTYCVMFYKYLQSSRATRREGTELQSAFSLFRKSKFFISVLLVLTYLVFAIVPLIVVTILHLTGTTFFHSAFLYLILYRAISLALSDTADAIIYIFLQSDIRKKLFQVLSRLLCSWHLRSVDPRGPPDNAAGNPCQPPNNAAGNSRQPPNDAAGNSRQPPNNATGNPRQPPNNTAGNSNQSPKNAAGNPVILQIMP